MPVSATPSKIADKTNPTTTTNSRLRSFARNIILIKRLRNMESEHGVESLVGNHNVLALGIDGNSAGILEEHVRSSNRQTRRYVSVIEDAPNANVIV